MKIRSFAHKGLNRLYSRDSAKGVPPETVDKLRKMLSFLDAMQEADELRMLTVRKVHKLTGDRKGTWSLSVTGNRRLTFTIGDDREICDLNLEDYHWQERVPNYAHEEPATPRRFHPDGDH